MKKLLKLLPLLLLLSCERGGPSLPDTRRADLSGIRHEMIVLGEKLEDPYSVENVSNALKSLYPTRAGRTDVRPTDMYVRFLPADEAEYEKLESLGITLVDHPLDYRIVRDGDYYHDPSLPDDAITWQYAVVPSGFVFPSGIRCEVLDQCYIADNDLATRASDIDWKAVEREAYRLTGNSDMLAGATRGEGEEGEDLIPSGRICIADEDYNGGEPQGVAGVLVCVNSFVKFGFAYTDENGYYEMKRSFSTDVRYRLVFRNRKGFGIGINMLLIPASVSTLGEHPAGGIDVTVDRNSEEKLFRRCVVNNAAWDYYTRCTSEGSTVTAPPANLRIWTLPVLPSSVSLMLQQGAVIDSEPVRSYLGEYSELIKIFMPDIILGLRGRDDYASIYAATLHALAHASHFMKAGKDYWTKYLMFVLKSYVANLGITYGSGTESWAGYCEVSEMWSYFYESLIYRERYGLEVPVEGTTHWFSPQILMYLEERGLGENKIFSALGSDITSVEKFHERLKNLYPEHLSIVDEAFNRYAK